MKLIYTLTAALLFTQIAPAQTTAPSSPPSFPALPSPRRTVPTRGGATNASSALVAKTNVVPSIPLGTNAAAVSASGANAIGAPKAGAGVADPVLSTSKIVPPAMNVPAIPSNSLVRTNATGEVADIEYNFQKMPVEQILQIYSRLIGRTILRAPTLPATTQIDLQTHSPLTRTEAITALEAILGMNGITMIPIADKFVKVVVEAQAGTAGGRFSEGTAGELREAGQYVTHIVRLKYAQAQEVQQAISPFAKTPASIIGVPTSNTLIIRDYSENVKRMLEVIESLDKITEMEVKPEVIPIKYALASDIQQVLGSLTASGPGISVGRSTRGAGVTPGGYQPGAVGSGVGGGSGFPGQTTQQPVQSGLNTAGTTGRNTFQRNLQSIVGRLASGAGEFQVIGNAKIIADDRTNSLLIFANDQDMVMIKTIISQLDVVLAQVLIEAIIMEVSISDGKNVGVSFLQQPQQKGNFTGAGGVNNGQTFLNPKNFISGSNSSPIAVQDLKSGFSYFGSFGNDLDVAVEAIATDSRVNVLSRPRIQTSHAVPATLFIGNTVPYITGSSSYLSVSGGTSSTYQEKRVGITLDVLPLINPDGLVVMDIQQNIQQLGENQIIDGNPVPTTTERSASAKVAVRDMETIILGGFISTTKNNSKSGVPYLKDLPVLGGLFRSSSAQYNKVELIVLLRPKVLPTPEAAALVAATERDKLSGVKQGEFEIREMERKRQEKIDADMRKKLGIKERPL